jgi:hypothetical protein
MVESARSSAPENRRQRLADCRAMAKVRAEASALPVRSNEVAQLGEHQQVVLVCSDDRYNIQVQILIPMNREVTEDADVWLSC